MNLVILTGRLVRNPELKYTPSGMAVTRMTIAVDKELAGEKKQEAINNGQPTADFIGISIFGKQAENCSNYLLKGSKCAVSGRINTGSYTTQAGEKRYTTDVIANRVEFLDSKTDRQAPQQEEDVFQPVTDADDIPF